MGKKPFPQQTTSAAQSAIINKTLNERSFRNGVARMADNVGFAVKDAEVQRQHQQDKRDKCHPDPDHEKCCSFVGLSRLISDERNGIRNDRTICIEYMPDSRAMSTILKGHCMGMRVSVHLLNVVISPAFRIQ